MTDITDNDWGYHYNQQSGAVAPDSNVSARNVYVMGPNGTGIFNYVNNWNTFNALHNNIDSNDYLNPFAVDSDVWRTANNSSGVPPYGQYYWTLAEIRGLTPWEDHSSYNVPSWTMADVPGLPESKMLWMYVNWSSTAHVFNLGGTTYRNLAGSDVSGSITVQPYKAMVLFYKSGTVPTHDNLTVYH